ncbi:hypothetical protein AX16_000851 [Volvariella volvacea WC 439]|nr:hypothetical protein AX16_000851 [Volvariella volvacea WC 439]
MPEYKDTAANLSSAKQGFDRLFENQILQAKSHFAGKDDPFHLLGLGVCSFLEAALGMETGLMSEASQLLAGAEQGAKKHSKSSRPKPNQRFAPGLEWEILTADAVVLLGLTHALRLYKTVFPDGLDTFSTPSATPNPSRKPSLSSLKTQLTVSEPPTRKSSGFFSRFTSSSGSRSQNSTPPLSSTPSSLSVSVSGASTPTLEGGSLGSGGIGEDDGPIEELIIAGTAFGYGLFNLVFSLLPKKVQGVVGFFGFKSDRKVALQALALAAAGNDVHSVFAGLVLMTYHGVVLLLSGFQADEQHIFRQYKAIVDRIETRYPDGALWILNRAKIMRMSYDAESAIRVLQAGLKPSRPHTFAQADTLLMFELAWTLLSQRRYQEAAEMFLKVTEVNSWCVIRPPVLVPFFERRFPFAGVMGRTTFSLQVRLAVFLSPLCSELNVMRTPGCHVSLGNLKKAQELFDAIPGLLEAKKLTGKDLPTEVFIKKKLEFYKEKQKRRGGDEKMFVEAMKISPAEELGIFWNTHARINKAVAEAHIHEWLSLTPAPKISTPYASRAVTPAASTPASPSPSTLAPPPALTPSLLSPLQPSTPSLSPHPPSSPMPSTVNPGGALPDLDTGDELAIRSLLLGITHRSASPAHYETAQRFLWDACDRQAKEGEVRVATWVAGVAMFELAVVELKMGERDLDLGGGDSGERESVVEESVEMVEAVSITATTDASTATLVSSATATATVTSASSLKANDKLAYQSRWAKILKEAESKLDKALSFATASTDLSSRLDSRIAMLRDEIGAKRELVGVV